MLSSGNQLMTTVYSVTGVPKLFIMQIRSDCDPMHAEKLTTELAAALAAANVAHAILVSGFGEDDVLDEHQPFRYILLVAEHCYSFSKLKYMSNTVSVDSTLGLQGPGKSPFRKRDTKNFPQCYLQHYILNCQP